MSTWVKPPLLWRWQRRRRDLLDERTCKLERYMRERRQQYSRYRKHYVPARKRMIYALGHLRKGRLGYNRYGSYRTQPKIRLY